MIFNEYEYAENLLESDNLKAIMRKDILTLVKYFIFIGKGKAEICQLVNDFYKNQWLQYDADLVGSYLEYSFKMAKRYKLRMPQRITITVGEIEEIEKLGDENEERLMATILFLAKYTKATNTNLLDSKKEYDSLFLKQSESSLVKLAKVGYKKDQWRDVFHKFTTMGFINPIILKKSKGLAFIVSCKSKDNTPAIICDNPDIFYRLCKGYKNNKLIFCESCGISTVKNSNRQTLCKECFAKHRKNYKAEKQKEYRDVDS